MDASDRWLWAWGLGYASIGAASLLLPLYAIELGADALLVGLMASTAAFAGIPGALAWGKLAGRTDRRRIFVCVALGSTAAVLAVVPLLDAPWHLLVANAAVWFFVAAAAPVLTLIVVDGAPASGWERRIGLLNHYQGYGWLLGLVAGAIWTGVTAPLVVTVTAQRLFFVLMALGAVVALALTLRWFPERQTLSSDRFRRLSRRIGRVGWGAGSYVRTVPFGPTRVYWALTAFDLRRLPSRVGTRSPLWGYLGAATLFFVGFSIFFGPLPAYLAGIGLGSDAIFVVFVCSSAGSAVCFARVGRVAERVNPLSLQSGSLVVRALAFPLVAVVGVVTIAPVSTAAIGLLVFLVGVTWAVIAVTATGMVTRLAPVTRRGDALGAYAAVGSLGGGVGSALGGWLATVFGFTYAFVVAAVVVLLGAGLTIATVRVATGTVGDHSVLAEARND